MAKKDGMEISSRGKGKVDTMDKDDSNGDSLDLDDEHFVKALTEVCKDFKEKKSLLSSVLDSFVNVANG